MHKVIKFSLPVYKTLNHRKRKPSTHLVGSNWFRNLHFQQKNSIKQEYGVMTADRTKGLEPIKGKFKTYYKFFYKSKVCDATNVISQIEKFMLDGLINAGMIEEDNVLFNIGSEGWEVCEDKLNPRLEIEIRSV